MSENETQQEGQKTVVSFVAGLLIGGLLVWVFGGAPESTEPTENADDVNVELTEEADNDEVAVEAGDDTAPAASEAPVMEMGEGSASVANQPAGMSVTLDRATFPVSEGWVAVRGYDNGQLSSILGAARFSEEQGLVPQEIPLLAPTSAGREYAVVFFTDDGDRVFGLAGDAQIEGVVATFTAQ